MATDPVALVDMVDGKLLAGNMSDTLRTEITTIVTAIPNTDLALRVAEAIYLVSTSPEFATQM